MDSYEGRAFIPVEEADEAISEVEEMLREAASSSARTVALAALLGVRTNLGLPIPDPSRDGSARTLDRLRRGPRGHLRIPRRTDGELSD